MGLHGTAGLHETASLLYYRVVKVLSIVKYLLRLDQGSQTEIAPWAK